jgi:hypothetical protein
LPVFQLYYSKKQKEILDAVKRYAQSKDISISQAIVYILAIIMKELQKEENK